jgi:predicted metal-dependent peptidase
VERLETMIASLYAQEEEQQETMSELVKLKEAGRFKRFFNKKKIAAAEANYKQQQGRVAHIKIEIKKKHKPMQIHFINEKMDEILRGGDAVRLAIDTSGSFTGDHTQEIIFFDHQITFQQRADEMTLPLALIGGGGTDYKTLFVDCENQGVQKLIIYTDGYGEAPLTSEIQTLWLIDNDGQVPYTNLGNGSMCSTQIGEFEFIPWLF